MHTARIIDPEKLWQKVQRRQNSKISKHGILTPVETIATDTETVLVEQLFLKKTVFFYPRTDVNPEQMVIYVTVAEMLSCAEIATRNELIQQKNN